MFVLPGDFLGYVEEYVPGEGVYEEDGKLFASSAGRVVVKDKKISVEGIKKVPEIKRNDIVVGRVVDTRNSFAIVEIARKRGDDRALRYYDKAFLHISNVSDGYIKSFESGVRYMDIIRARVIDDNLRLSIKEKDMGVIKASCQICGSTLERERDKLKCPQCGNVETRKISNYYGKGEW